MSKENDGAGVRAELERLARRVQRLEDEQAIQKLQSKYAHYLFTQRYARIVEECFARHTADVTLEFSDSGVYRGLERIRAVYRDFEAAKDRIPGFFILHMAVNPYIEIAGDGRSARSHWLSPGAVGSNTSAGWVWGPYYIDYLKEDGEWRIVHSNLAPLFRNRYDVSWAEAKDHGTVRTALTSPPDEPPTLYRPYNEVKSEPDLFKRHPDLPPPY
ncbi:MAG TPA: nuclear transport factor 2 family protein [Steroidobacteraceae bacterium]|nr:nuclear transport factor 2 family protein [Steroidobacteraceae bacterium]